MESRMKNALGLNMWRVCLLVVVMVFSACEGTSNAEPPLPSGDYAFMYRFEEHPGIPSIELSAQIRGRHIVLINNNRTDVFPKGVIEEGTLMWHAGSGQWIIVTDPDDADALNVGACSDGPSVVDLQRRIYWTC